MGQERALADPGALERDERSLRVARARHGVRVVDGSFSTALMVRDGKVYSNLMVGMTPVNAKLRGRALRILVEATGQDEDHCAGALTAADGDTKTALVCLLAGVEVAAAAAALDGTDGNVRAALAALHHNDRTPEPEVF